mgnify:CR=1 FL=1
MAEPIVFDPELIRRYDVAGPRYTSYPTAVQFTDEYDEAAYRRQLADSNRGGRPLSLYVHLPFCDTVCFYCACNKIVTKNRARAAPYVSHLVREVELQGGLIDATRVVEQLHWGGGTPTFLSHDEMRTVMDTTRRHFRLRDDDGGQNDHHVPNNRNDLEDLTHWMASSSWVWPSGYPFQALPVDRLILSGFPQRPL